MRNDLLLKACRREPVPRTPVWFMRQAGRYLPEYRAVRDTVDFLTLCKTPDLAAQVTIQPVDIVGVDAAIIFSDILVVPEAMGMQLVVEEEKGSPTFSSPLRQAPEIGALRIPDPHKELAYVLNAIKAAKEGLWNRVPLIGFSGAPWTLAAYMVEGRGSRDFRHVKQLVYEEPGLAHALLEKLAQSVTMYCRAQVDAGADVIQVFDTWGGLLPKNAFHEFSLRYIQQIVGELKKTGVPVIVFCKDSGHSLTEIAETGADVVGLDWTVDIGEARRMIGDRAALQGNLDPAMLFARPEVIQRGVADILSRFGPGTGHVFNLGHGVLPDTPVEHAKAFVQAVKDLSAKYHQRSFCPEVV